MIVVNVAAAKPSNVVHDGAHPRPPSSSSSSFSGSASAKEPAAGAKVHEMRAACRGSLAASTDVVAQMAGAASADQLPLNLPSLSGCQADCDDVHSRVCLAVALLPSSQRVLSYTPVIRTASRTRAKNAETVSNPVGCVVRLCFGESENDIWTRGNLCKRAR